MKLVFLAAAGGAFGAAARYLMGIATTRLLGHGFPWGTITVNIAGSFLMGLLIALLARSSAASNEIRVFLAVGLLGGFTTFSAFSLDFIVLVERKAHLHALGYMAGSVVISIAALFAGLALIRSFGA